MMKRKSKSGLLGSKWVMRYFVLYSDGKLVYYRDKPEGGADANSKMKSEVLCDHIGECTLDIVNASDLAGRADSVANSFYITGKGRSKGAEQRTLLVTNGPKEFKRWILAFSNMEVEMLHGVGSDVKESKNSSPNKMKEIVPLQISFDNADKVNEGMAVAPQASLDDTKTTIASPQSVRFAADVDMNRELREDQEDAKSVTFSVQDAEFIRDAEAVSGDDKSVTFSDRSVTFSDRDDVISGDRSVTFSDYDAEIILDAFSGDDIESGHVVEQEENASSLKEADITAANEAAAAKAEEERNEVEKKVAANKVRAVEVREQEMKKAAEKIKVFSYGDLYDDMVEALDTNKVLFGIITTSVEEMLDDEAYLRTDSKEHHSELTPISIQYSGTNAHYTEVNNYKNHLHEIGSFCERFCNVDGLNPIVYFNKIETRNRILTLLGEAHQDEVYQVETPDSPKSKVSQRAAQFRSMRIADTGGLTAYKHALNIQGADGVPSGPELLKIVREPLLGAPYNWVLFKASKEDLIIEDGGSGGVMELAKVVHRDHNDKVLFGLARVSFAGDFGLRQFWCALEWKGENASGVKALKSYTEALAPMADRIGDRSFTLSNSSAMDLSPQIVVDFVKKSCNVEFLDVTVEALKNAHEEEQKAIEEYWDKLEAKEKAKVDARNAEKSKREEEEREARLKIRTSKLAKTKGLREARKKRWSEMNAPELLEDLGKGNLSGWVLLQVNLEK